MLKGSDKKLLITAGHYGSGKTNLAVNLALALKAAGVKKVSLCDADIVNPYFRTKDSEDVLNSGGVKLIAPQFANSNLDIPSMPPEINSVFDDASVRAVFDVGGDDSGAVALGQYAAQFDKTGYEMYLVVNSHRFLTREPEMLMEFVYDMECASHLKFTSIINNTNIGKETTQETLLASLAYMERASGLLKLPIAFTAIERTLLEKLRLSGNIPDINIFPITVYGKKDWIL